MPGYRRQQRKQEPIPVIGKTPAPARSIAAPAFKTMFANVKIHDLACLNLAYWLYGKTHSTPEKALVFDPSSVLSDIFGGVLSLRWNAEWHLRALGKWSFKRYYFELYKRQAAGREGEDTNLKALRILNEYSAQKLGQAEFHTNLVFPSVSLKAAMKDKCMKKYPENTFETVFNWFKVTVLTNDANDSDLDFIHAEMVEKHFNFSDCNTDSLFKYLKRTRLDAFSVYFENYKVFVNFLYHGFMYPLANERAKKTNPMEFEIFNIAYTSDGSEVQSHIIESNGEKKVRMNIAERLDHDDPVWNPNHMLMNIDIEGLESSFDIKKLVKLINE